MSRDITFHTKSLTASEYILALHEPEDRVAALLVNRRRGQSLQRIASAQTVAAPDFQKWLADRNRAGSDVFVGMNPLKEGATTRTKESLRDIRHVYLDLDENAEAALASVRDSLDVPAPNFVLDTSPHRHQVVWKIEGVDIAQGESLLRALANQFGGDTAATDATRVLRLPGFANLKHTDEQDFRVRANQEADRVYTLRDFSIPDDSPDFDRAAGDIQPVRVLPRRHKSQSEADWAYAKRALARGDDPDEIVRRIADYRAHDKHDPEYYARRTVLKARAELEGTSNFEDLRADDARLVFKRH